MIKIRIISRPRKSIQKRFEIWGFRRSSQSTDVEVETEVATVDDGEEKGFSCRAMVAERCCNAKRRVYIVVIDLDAIAVASLEKWTREYILLLTFVFAYACNSLPPRG